MPVCVACEESQARNAFSNSQLKQSAMRRRCTDCVRADFFTLADILKIHHEIISDLHNASPNMKAAFDSLMPDVVGELECIARAKIDDWQQVIEDLAHQREFQGGFASDYLLPLPDKRFHVLPWSRTQDLEDEVCIVKDVFTLEQCDTILDAIQRRAAVRGGWDEDRHANYPTTDMRCAEACVGAPDIEQMVRAAVFEKICEPLATRWAGSDFLAEHLVFRDFFFVHYSAASGEQRGLQMHQDGSLFSFNVLLTDPCGFDGGGTTFAPRGYLSGHGQRTVTVPRGAALVHSGSLRHGGNDITRGSRTILVGFMGRPKPQNDEQKPIDSALPTCAVAAQESFFKFGKGAWCRSASLVQVGGALPLST